MGQRGRNDGADGMAAMGGSNVVLESQIGSRTEAGISTTGSDLTVRNDGGNKSNPVSPSAKAPEPCRACGAAQSAIRINVDGNTLLMESCDECDVRRWQLEGERIDLQEALNQVGEHSGRRRSRS